jgi:chromosome segregation ATPase
METKICETPTRAIGPARAIGMHAMALCMLTTTGPLLYGCSTTDELEAMRTTMSANKRSVETRLRQLEDSRKKLEDRQAALDRHLEERLAKTSDLDQRYQATLEDHGRSLTVYEDSIARLSGMVRDSAGDIRELRQTLQKEEGAISRVLDAEEAFHKEGLRSLQIIRNDLSSGTGKSGKSRRTATQRETDDMGFDEQLLR